MFGLESVLADWRQYTTGDTVGEHWTESMVAKDTSFKKVMIINVESLTLEVRDSTINYKCVGS